jgi:hypothetical protein
VPFVFVEQALGPKVCIKKLTMVIEGERNGYISFCPELDIASRGDTIKRGQDNL